MRKMKKHSNMFQIKEKDESLVTNPNKRSVIYLTEFKITVRKMPTDQENNV